MSKDTRNDNESNFDLKQLTKTLKAGLYTCMIRKLLAMLFGTQLTQ